MKSKEEIREHHLYKHGLSVNNSSVGKKIQDSAFGAMDEYAKQVAVDFGIWLSENCEAPPSVTVDYWYYYSNATSKEQRMDTEQLFELYKKEKEL